MLVSFNKIVDLFKQGNVSVSGLRGRGKDVLMSNVIARRKNLDYVSNIDYGYKYNSFDYKDFDTKNTYVNFIEGNIKKYSFPFPDKTDLYLSDCGIFFPSQYQGELVKRYPNLITFQALSRHLGLCNVHTNSQTLSRVWDKIREQSDTYIVCQWCKFLFGKIVIQNVRIYEKYDSADKNVPPIKLRVPLFNKVAQTQVRLQKVNYRITYGDIKNYTLIYLHKGKYDTRAFRKLLKEVKIPYEFNEKEKEKFK